MELTVFRQASKEREDGTVVYKGEDARPYVGEHFLFVADGLGGASAIRHQQINPDLFDKDKLMDTLFKGIYDDYSDEAFVKYVTESFFELFAVKDCYTDNVNNIKKSGYFASRIVAAILLHGILCSKDTEIDELIKTYNSFESQEEKDKFLKDTGDFFAKGIGDELRKIAKNANLFYESSYSGLALLGTTLCATFYFETDDYVEAIYLTAGDSRPYVWTEKDGLCQVLDDQEGKDGGMTNYIKANEGESFSVRCNYMRFGKPCILFNASDGCFDSGYFLSQMAFEKLILETGVSSSDIEAMSNGLYEFFVNYGKHDDSSTIAMRFFGFEDYQAFQSAASKRLEKINDAYISRLPDLLSHDYISECEKDLLDLPERLAAFKTEFGAEESVKDYCTVRISQENYPMLETRLQQIDKEINDSKSQIAENKDLIEKIVVDNFVRFSRFVNCGADFMGFFLSAQIEKLDQRQQQQSAEYADLIKKYKDDLDDVTKQLKNIVEKIDDVGVPTDYSGFDFISSLGVEDCQNTMNTLFAFIFAIRNHRQEMIRTLSRTRTEYVNKNHKLADMHEREIDEICEMLIAEKINCQSVKEQITKKEYDELIRALSRIKEIDSNIERLNKTERQRAVSESRDAYWEENYVALISDIVSDASVKIPNELRKEVKSIIDSVGSDREVIKAKAELQEKLFEQYDKVYNRYIGGVSV